MPVYLRTLGKSVIGIGVCDRCKFKTPIADLVPDPNIPGLRVHKHCADQFDPWRLPALQDDRINLPFVRPDSPLTGINVPVDYTLRVFITQTGNPLVSEAGSQ